MADLHIRRWGNGTRVAVLIHGLTADSTSWWRLGPTLAERGYTVLAPDLPGHGDSPRATVYTVEAMAAAVAAALPAHPELAVGHSLGGLLLAHIADELAPDHVVYVDPAWSPGDPATAAIFRAQKTWTLEQIQASAPRWEPRVHHIKLESLRRWDTDTLSMIENVPDFLPGAPHTDDLVLLADPSRVVPPAKADALSARGFEVRIVPHAGHVIHNDDFPGFLARIEDRIAPAVQAPELSGHADPPSRP